MIVGNPMTDDFTRAACAAYPEHLQNLLGGIDRFAYDAAAAIETPYGEYAGETFNKDVLVEKVRASVHLPLQDPRAPMGHNFLALTFQKSGLPSSKLDRIITIVEEEALKRIDVGVYTRESDGAIRYREHGHHGRQYIARNSTHRAVVEVLPFTRVSLVPKLEFLWDSGLKSLGFR